MPDYTENLKLIKPEKTEFYNIDIHNQNSDIIDEFSSAVVDEINRVEEEGKTANFTLETKLTNAYKLADTALDTKVTNAYKAADTALDTKLTNAYQTADTTLDTKLTNAYQTADENLETKLTNAYKAADTALNANLTHAYTSADTALDTKLTNAYKAADTALDTKLTNAYKAADTALETKLTNMIRYSQALANNYNLNTFATNANIGTTIFNVYCNSAIATKVTAGYPYTAATGFVGELRKTSSYMSMTLTDNEGHTWTRFYNTSWGYWKSGTGAYVLNTSLVVSGGQEATYTYPAGFNPFLYASEITIRTARDETEHIDLRVTKSVRFYYGGASAWFYRTLTFSNTGVHISKENAVASSLTSYPFYFYHLTFKFN